MFATRYRIWDSTDSPSSFHFAKCHEEYEARSKKWNLFKYSNIYFRCVPIWPEQLRCNNYFNNVQGLSTTRFTVQGLLDQCGKRCSFYLQNFIDIKFFYSIIKFDKKITIEIAIQVWQVIKKTKLKDIFTDLLWQYWGFARLILGSILQCYVHAGGLGGNAYARTILTLAHFYVHPYTLNLNPS